MTTAVKFWDGVAAKYARSPIKDMAAYEHTLARTATYLKKTDDVLELGCGTGMTALRLSGYVDTITASDLSPGMLAVGRKNAAEQNIENIAFVEADATRPPAWSYDVALAFNLLHLVEDLDSALSQVHSVLNPRGLFISKTFCSPQRGGGLQYLAIRLALPVMQFFGKAPFVRFLSEADLDATIEQAGFEIVERDSFPARNGRRFLVARKI